MDDDKYNHKYKYSFKQATSQDYAQLIKHWIQLSQFLPQKHFQPFGNLVVAERTPQLETALTNTLDSENAAVFVCESHQQIVASIAVVLNNQSGYSLPKSSVLFNLWVNEHWRRQGIASQLLEEAYNWLAKQNVDSVQVGWHPENTGASIFWNRHGFRQYEIIASRRLETPES